MKNFIIFNLLISFSQAHAQSVLDKILFELQYKEYVLHPPKEKPVDPNIECIGYLKKAQESWITYSGTKDNGLIPEGDMGKVFTKEQILNRINGLKPEELEKHLNYYKGIK